MDNTRLKGKHRPGFIGCGFFPHPILTVPTRVLYFSLTINKMPCKNCGFKSCRCYDSSDLDSEGEDIFYVSDYSSQSDDSADEDYVTDSSDDDDD